MMTTRNIAMATLLATTMGYNATAQTDTMSHDNHNHESMHQGIEVTEAWLRPTPPNAPVGGGFLTLTNHTDEADALVGFDSSIGGSHEIHDMEMKDGMMNMFELEDGATLPAGETVTFKPMQKHLMFLQLSTMLKPGDTHSVTLNFEHADDQDVVFTVKSLEEIQAMSEKADQKDHMHGHHHHGHGHSHNDSHQKDSKENQ